MDERPAILQWKVVLLLVAVVVAAIAVGGALRVSRQENEASVITLWVSGVPSARSKITPKMITREAQMTIQALPPKTTGFLPARETLLDRLIAWLDLTFSK